MKHQLLLLVSMASAAGNASADTSDGNPAQPTVLTKEQAQLIYSLAERPLAVVEGNKCHVRGAVWQNGPVPGAKSALINVQSGEVIYVKTNENGVYSASVPYAGKPMVFQERVVSDLFVPRGMELHIQDGGVVCDHRLNLSQMNKETK